MGRGNIDSGKTLLAQVAAAPHGAARCNLHALMALDFHGFDSTSLPATQSQQDDEPRYRSFDGPFQRQR
jgi:hypothetical protein